MAVLECTRGIAFEVPISLLRCSCALPRLSRRLRLYLVSRLYLTSPLRPSLSFHEFLRYYEMLIASGDEFSEIARMFCTRKLPYTASQVPSRSLTTRSLTHRHPIADYFDKDRSGELDKAELLCLLNQIFPDRCDEVLLARSVIARLTIHHPSPNPHPRFPE